MRFLYFFFVIFFTFSSFSQNNSAKEKVNFLIKNKPSNREFIDSIFKNNRKIKADVELLIKRSEEESYLLGKYYGYNALGRIYRDISLFKNSLELYKKALKAARQLKDLSLELKVLNSIGSVYRRQEDVRNALNYHQEALDKALTIKNPNRSVKKSISISQNSLGNIYISLKQYQLAINQFNEAILIQKELNNELGLAINYQNIGNAQDELGNLENALKNYHKSLKYNNKINSNIGKIICSYSIANLLIKQKKYNQALITIDTVLPIAIKKKDKYYLAYTYNTLGLAQLYLNQFSLAKENLNIGLDIASEYNVQNVVVKAHENLALLHEKRNEYEKAYKHFKKAKEEELKTFNEYNLLYVSELITKYDKERSENQIKTLAKQNEIAQLEIDRNRIFFIVITSLLALLAVIGYSITRQRSLKNEKKLLTLKQEALQSQMNPHFIFNALNSIKLYIINNEQKNAVYYLNKFAKLIRKILEASKVKEISLRVELETMELYMSIENIRFNNEINYTFNVDESLNLDNIKIPPLVLQPFLENSIWHGLSSKKGEKKVSLSVKKIDNDFIQVSIEDNGIGRKASAEIKANKKTNRKSIGIDLTAERLRSFVKDFSNDFSLKYFDITNDKKITGTKVSIKIPLI